LTCLDAVSGTVAAPLGPLLLLAQVGVDLGVSNTPAKYAAAMRALAADTTAVARRAALRRGAPASRQLAR
jgi:hypothetical protein